MKTINTDKAKELIRETNGKIFSSTFIKKDGSHRLMNARLKVKKGLKENAKPQPYEPSKYNLLCVYDMIKKAYRMINLNTLLTLTINKNTYKITEEDNFYCEECLEEDLEDYVEQEDGTILCYGCDCKRLIKEQ
tara:strand:+ start:334 stop:735 length:402 start_codon:yes stop_codon:yes gene_type:complete